MAIFRQTDNRLEMKEDCIFIKLPDGSDRGIDVKELNQLKKDILWIFDENFGDIKDAFVPSYSFTSKYWEYLTLRGGKWLNEDDKTFYLHGVLTILLCCCSEYLDTEAGSQDVFDAKELPTVSKYVQEYQPKDQTEKLVKDKILLGLRIAQSMNANNLSDYEFVHEDNDKYYRDINVIGNVFIRDYYESNLKDPE